MKTVLAKSELILNFALGKLSEAEMEQAMALFAEDETTLEALEKLWQKESRSLHSQLNLNKEKARRLEHKIKSQLNRAGLAKNMVALGTHGFSSVAVGLLRPFLKH